MGTLSEAAGNVQDMLITFSHLENGPSILMRTNANDPNA